MRTVTLWTVGAVAVLAVPPLGWAERISDFARPRSAAHAAFLAGGEVASASFSSGGDNDTKRPAGTSVPACSGSCEAGYDPSCYCDGCHGAAASGWFAPDPSKPNFLQALGIKAGGWVQVGHTFNAEDPADKYNGPLLTNDRASNPQMNQLWTYVHRPVDTGGAGFDLGGRIDLLYGTDWRVAYFHGLGMEGDLSHALLNGSNQLYGLAIPQFYAEAGLNNLSVKVGRMTGILGYEICPPMGNFFYSHSYTICYGEPVLITGVMNSYKVTDQLTFLAGAHQGIHRFEENNDKWNVQGGATWTGPGEMLSLAYAFDMGRNDFIFPLGDEYIHSLVTKLQLTENLLYVLQSDLGVADGAGAGPDAEWYGINQYLLATLSEKWSAGMRIEWFRDDDGTRVFGFGNLDAKGWSGGPGFNGSFTALTLGLNYKPKINIFVRPEVRWDWYNGSTNIDGELPFDDGHSSDQLTFATDLVVMF